MNYKKISLALLLAVLCVLAYCSSSIEPTDTVPVDTIPADTDPAPFRLPSELTATERQVAASTNKFGFKLFDQVTVATPTDSNIFISPLSVAYALAMTYNGAAGVTRDEIVSTLAMDDLTTEQINESFAGLTEVLTGADPSVITTIANAVWYTPRRTLAPEYGDICREYFNARVSALDFTRAWAADTINKWASENTHGKIKKVVDPPLDPNLVFILANAVYFKANWTFPFDPEKTRTDSFYLADGGSTSADFMYLNSEDYQDENFQPDPDFTYLVKWDDFMAFSMPYGDRWFRMTVFLPDSSQSVEQFISQFTVEKWELWRTEFHAGHFMAMLPKFKFAYGVALDSILQMMGIKIAFQPGAADFTNMIEGGGIWIDTAFHKTFVQVDEKGTEAAAVTVIGGQLSMPPFMNCNRPFVFIIWEKESGAVMFAGKVARPVWEE
jgi:serine protease inhibitor